MPRAAERAGEDLVSLVGDPISGLSALWSTRS